MQCPACGGNLPDDAVVCVGCGRAVVPLEVVGPGYAGAEVLEFQAKRIPAGVWGILLGSLGVHKFILGLTTPGIIMLLTTLLTCGLGALVMSPIGLIEGILYLTKNDREFYREYAVEKKGWF